MQDAQEPTPKESKKPEAEDPKTEETEVSQPDPEPEAKKPEPEAEPAAEEPVQSDEADEAGEKPATEPEPTAEPATPGSEAKGGEEPPDEPPKAETSLQGAAPGKGKIKKIAIGLAGVIGASVIGYFVVYSWVFYDLGGIFTVNALKGSVTGNAEEDNMKEQLADLGFNFSDTDFFCLSCDDSTVHLKSSVVGGYQPVEMTEEEIAKGVVDSAYFYDEHGNPYYFELDENGKIIPESLIPLIAD